MHGEGAHVFSRHTRQDPHASGLFSKGPKESPVKRVKLFLSASSIVLHACRLSTKLSVYIMPAQETLGLGWLKCKASTSASSRPGHEANDHEQNHAEIPAHTCADRRWTHLSACLACRRGAACEQEQANQPRAQSHKPGSNNNNNQLPISKLPELY